MRIVWSPQSLRDLHAIREYIAKDSECYADLTVARIFSAVERLLPGRIVPERNDPKIREVIVGRFRVVYRVRDGRLEVATVFRASREFRRDSDPPLLYRRSSHQPYLNPWMFSSWHEVEFSKSGLTMNLAVENLAAALKSALLV